MWLGFRKCDPEQEGFIVVLQLRFDRCLNVKEQLIGLFQQFLSSLPHAESFHHPTVIIQLH